MNRLFLILLPLLCFYSNVFAQFSDSDLRQVDGFSIGIEKNNSGWIDYGFKSGFHINVKHTLIADKLPRQSWRIGGSYNITPKYIQFNISPFVTSDWYFDSANIGSSFKLSNFWKEDRFKIGAEYVPYYDSELNFQNGWAVAAQARISNVISILFEYGRKPDYRIAYKRAYFGFDLKVLDLDVKPMLEIPVYDSGLRLDHSRVVISTFYTFKKKDKENINDSNE